MEMILWTAAVLGVAGALIGLMLVYAGDKFAVPEDPKQIAVRGALPGNNCGACGFAGCDAMAAAIAKGEAPVNGCPVGGAAAGAKIAAIMGVEAAPAEKKVAFVKCAGTCGTAAEKGNYVGVQTCAAAAVIPGKGSKACQFGCLGFGSCAAVCTQNAIHVVDGVAKVDRNACRGCGRCAAVCPQKLIDMIPDSAPLAVQCGNRNKGPVVKKLCDAGCLGCGACVRQCEAGAISLSGDVAVIDYEKCVGCGKCAAKCPSKIIRMR